MTIKRGDPVKVKIGCNVYSGTSDRVTIVLTVAVKDLEPAFSAVDVNDNPGDLADRENSKRHADLP
jgi:hypothetical protein